MRTLRDRRSARLPCLPALVAALGVAGCGSRPAAGDETATRAHADTSGPKGHAGPRGTRSPDTVQARDLATVYLALRGPAPADLVPDAASAADPAVKVRVRERIATVDAEQDELAKRVEAEGGEVIARLRELANALEVVAPRALLPRLARLPGVESVEPVTLHTAKDATEVAFTGAVAAWERATSLTGTGIRVGVCDSGIDYDHADFGGPGTAAAYTANVPTVIEPGSFPTAKVIGGWDFVGDAYDAQASPSPKPDPDPRDCLGHGTLVAGTIAGFGVTPEGATFASGYAQSFDPTAFSVGPGIAPDAKLMSFKIFGCNGATAVLDSALSARPTRTRTATSPTGSTL